MDKIYVGWDNGTTGSIGILYPDKLAVFFPTPSFQEFSYTKDAKKISRIDFKKTCALFEEYVLPFPEQKLALVERPVVNPKMFSTTISAARALEATLIVLEQFKIPFRYVDSKEWQHEMLPKGLQDRIPKGTKSEMTKAKKVRRAERKMASRDIGKRAFPHLDFPEDADSILMAEWARRNNL